MFQTTVLLSRSAVNSAVWGEGWVPFRGSRSEWQCVVVEEDMELFLQFVDHQQVIVIRVEWEGIADTRVRASIKHALLSCWLQTRRATPCGAACNTIAIGQV